MKSFEPVTEEREVIAEMVRHAVVPPMLAALAQTTGDLSLLRPEFTPDSSNFFDPQGGLGPEAVTEARSLIVDALCAFRDAGCPTAPAPDHETLVSLINFLLGHEVPAKYIPLLEEELAVTGEDLRAPGWSKETVAPDRPFRVAVIGAGMSGLAAAHRVTQAGIDCVVLEKNGEVGGTWLENAYPGCRVDVSNHYYSYSFAQDEEWPLHYSTQQVLLDYFRRCADTFGLRSRIRFGTEVTGAVYDEAAALWRLELSTPDGEDTLEAHAVISAVGQLNRPRYPDIPGRDSFSGPAFHTARWDPHVDLAGKRVAVIGTGATGAQVIPALAEEAAQLTVFQRTAPWMVPTPDYHYTVSPKTRWLMTHVPYYARWYRFWLFWRSAEGILPASRVDESWDVSERSVSAANDLLRESLTAYLAGQFSDRPDLFEKVVPDYPPGAKRILRDNGIWARTLKRPNVELVADRIAGIDATGVRMAEGRHYEADVIVYATGFTASEFLTPMKVVGRGGIDLHGSWAGDARAYLGMTVPGFPNLFMLYGPNTNLVANGSIIFFSECEIGYVMDCLRLLLQGGHRSLEVRREVHDGYNAAVDAANRSMAWGASAVSSWYKNSLGRVSQNWPYSLLEFWERTRQVDPSDYTLS